MRNCRKTQHRLPGEGAARRLCWLAPLALCTPFFTGCADDSSAKGSSIHDRQDAALKDPFNYGKLDDSGRPSVTGGGLGEFDKGSFKSDLDRMMNP